MIFAVLQELIEKLGKGELPKNDYPCMNDPSPTMHGTTQGLSVHTSQVQPAHSRRTATWAKPHYSDDGYSRYSFLHRNIVNITIFICH